MIRFRLGRGARAAALVAGLLLGATAGIAGDNAPWSDERGSGDPTIVLLHGIGADRNVWNLVAPHLVRNHRVVVVDLPGHGSSPPIRDVSVANVARAVDRALSDRHVEHALLVGHSYGAWVALEEAAVNPRRVAGVVVLDIGAFTPADTARTASLERYLRDQYPSLIRVIFEGMSIDPVESDSAVAHALRLSPDVLRAYFLDSWHTDMRDRIRDLTVPIHVVATTSAWPASQSWEDARARAGYATKGPVVGHRIDGSAHLIMRDRPDTLATIVERIAAELPR